MNMVLLFGHDAAVVLMAGHQVVEDLLVADRQVLPIGSTNNFAHVIQLIDETEFALIDDD